MFMAERSQKNVRGIPAPSSSKGDVQQTLDHHLKISCIVLSGNAVPLAPCLHVQNAPHGRLRLPYIDTPHRADALLPKAMASALFIGPER